MLSTLEPTTPYQPKASAAPVRILLVDDSTVILRLLRRMLDEDSACCVVGEARSGVEALDRITELNPDLLVLDIEMPEMTGLELLTQLRRRPNKPRVIMFSSLTQHGARATIDALLAGADDYVTKQSDMRGEQAFTSVQTSLLQKIRKLFRPNDSYNNAGEDIVCSHRKELAFQPRPGLMRRRKSADVLVIGVSTGGPAALAAILPQVPGSFPLPILIVQHMPPLFTKTLAERLSTTTQMPVAEAAHDMELTPGRMLIAPGNYHLRLVRKGAKVFTALDQEPQEHSCRPSVDVLFRSAANVFQGSVIAAVLTGMGQDGIHGARALHKAGAYIMAQDEKTSVVWGMPKAIVDANIADAVLPLSNIVPSILELV